MPTSSFWCVVVLLPVGGERSVLHLGIDLEYLAPTLSPPCNEKFKVRRFHLSFFVLSRIPNTKLSILSFPYFLLRGRHVCRQQSHTSNRMVPCYPFCRIFPALNSYCITPIFC